ncbi:unnamed protein product [Rhodiola kirilowii]
MDFFTHLPPSAGHSAIMVVVDCLSKYSHFSPLKGGYTAAHIASVFFRDIIKLHGFQASIVSDRDPIFMSKFWKALFKQQGTLLAHTTAYNPQGDGKTEVVNRSLEDYLRCFVSDHQRDWVSLLPWAEFSYNTALYSIGMTPYEAFYGRPPPSLLDHIPGAITVAAVEEHVQNRTQLLQDLTANLTRACHRMQQQANAKRQDKTFEVDDLAWVKLQPYCQNSLRSQRMSKLAKRFYGPFPITNRIGAVAYRLKLPPTARIHNVFHVALLRRFVGDRHQVAQDLPAQFEGTKPLMTPECILRTRSVKVQNTWRTQWLIKWEGLPDTDATWEFKDDFTAEFPDLNLETKVAFHEGGIDGPNPEEATYMHEDGPPNQTPGAGKHAVPLRRGTRAREPSKRIPAGEYSLDN